MGAAEGVAVGAAEGVGAGVLKFFYFLNYYGMYIVISSVFRFISFISM